MRCDVTVSHTFAISQPCCIAEWHWPQPWIDCGVRTGRRYGVPAPWPMHCCECVVTLSGLVPAVVHMISDRVGCGVLRVPVGSLRVTKRSTVTCLRIYGFTPLPPPLAGRPADAHLLIKSSPVGRTRLDPACPPPWLSWAASGLFVRRDDGTAVLLVGGPQRTPMP